VLSRWPIDSAWKLVLPHESNVRRQRRTVTAAVVRVRGVPVRVYAVHLEIPKRASRADREDQVDAVLADAAGAPEPVIIAGDFNSWSIGEYLSARGFAWPTRDVGSTVMAFGWDHIFARGLAPAADAAGVVRDARGASDHKPVWAGLTMAVAPAAGASSAP
jgi:endonuclease/exonuclease/phosphatase family metal-dependent hydrolase